MKWAVSGLPNDASTKEELLNQAQKVFAEVGFKEATVREICKRASANVCLVSYYFGGKEELYMAVFERVGKQRLSMVQNLLGETSSIHSKEEFTLRLKLFLKAMYQEVASKPEFFRIMHREMSEGMPRAEEFIKVYVGGMKGIFTSFLDFGQKKKYVRKHDPQLLAMSLINMIFGFLVQQLNKPEFFFKGLNQKEISERILDTIDTVFFNGVLA